MATLLAESGYRLHSMFSVREPNFNQIQPRKRRKITTGEYETKLKFE